MHWRSQLLGLLFRNRKHIKRMKLFSTLSLKSRPQLLAWLLLVILGIFTIRLFYLQVIRHEYYSVEAAKTQQTKFTIEPERGVIYAKNGNNGLSPLVLNETVYTVFADPKEVEDPSKVRDTLRSVAGGNVVNDSFDLLTDKDKRYIVLARQVSMTQAQMIKKADLAGVGLQEGTRRVYPEGSLGAQTLGFVNAENKGQYGIEQALNGRLTGTPGLLQAVTDVRRIPLTIGDDDIRIPAKDGDDLVLTIDRNIQAQTEQILQNGLKRANATKGSMVVMDPATGAVMAMANFPTYNPAEYNKVEDGEVFQNAIVSNPYEAGSVIKTLTVGAGLDSGAVGVNSTFDNTGSVKVDDTTIRNVEEDPIFPGTTLTDTLRYSLNTGVVHVLQQMGGGSVNKKARETLENYFTNHYRFGQLTGIEQAGEAAGTISGANEGDGRNVKYATMTYGQGMDVTMIQTAGAFSAAINGGTFYQPHLVAGVRQLDGTVKNEDAKILGTNVLKPEVSAELQEMIYQGRHLGFFGKNDPAGFRIGGKTGTSQVYDENGKVTDKNSVGSYLGFGGVDQPKYVIMVRVLDSKATGGYEGTTAAGPIFNDMSNWMLQYLQLRPKR